MPAAVAKQRPQDRLDVYTVVTTEQQLAEFEEKGLDIASSRATANGFRAQMILTADQVQDVRADGASAKLTRVKGGKTVKQFAAAQAANGFAVWKSYDEPGGFRDQMYALAAKYPSVTKLVKIGTTIQGREILALKVTAGARGQKDGKRPAVLFSATQHAREWIASEIDRRLMYHYIEGWDREDPAIVKLLQSTELWFVPIMNPDGYQYTFTNERLWRKNLRDNDGDHQITNADGVDPNRNYPEHWKYDEEGSSKIISSQTYRGPGPASEAETQAIMGLSERIGFEFNVNYHSNGRWLLYPEGWQTNSPTADDPIYFALSGNLDRPAIDGFHPGLSSDVLYVTNGEANDYLHKRGGALAWTPELSPGCPSCGFVFPDDEALVQQEFERNLPFAESVANSAADPDDPKSSLGIKTKPFYVKSDDPYKSGLPYANFTFKYSYGDPQPVQVLAKRALGAVTVKYQINGGPTRSATTSEWTGGEKYKPAARYYHVMRGTVTGTKPGDSVKVWFEGGGQTSESFTYQMVSDSNRQMLVVSAEDYTGASPAQGVTAPKYAQTFIDALAANGVQADVYDVDKSDRTAPDALGVLSHYKGVIWYTGDDAVTREGDGRGPGNADRLALDEMLEMRAYMDEGGRVAYTGRSSGMQFTGAGVGTQFYDPKDEAVCRINGANNPALDPRRCLVLRGSTQGGDLINDVLQYWFGGMIQIAGDGQNGTTPFGLNGIGNPFAGLSWSLTAPQPAVTSTSSYVTTSGILAEDEYPQFASSASARWAKPGGPFDPHEGSKYVYSQLADASYKRLTREIAVPAGGGELTFWTSYDTEQDWDYLTVEARTAGGTDWTTLPDANGHTGTGTGQSCPGSTSGWAAELHPHLTHYQTYHPGSPATCTPTGSTGVWNAATGSSNGWQQWRINLGAYAGKTVEISVAYISDWGTQNLGVFLDEFAWPGGSTSFEGTDTGGWTVTGPPEGSGPNSNNFEITDAGGFPVGAAITTPKSLLMGYGFETISTADQRKAVMGRIATYLLR
ncbi:MAG TPA: M14 family zinc carboxypeptidase [Solirubrobacteraceae bacterium]|nr:M14 family zinc carboxypeptidase [Solirubrobacteraceae bacterium]